jgi:hypothetical protein
MRPTRSWPSSPPNPLRNTPRACIVSVVELNTKPDTARPAPLPGDTPVRHLFDARAQVGRVREDDGYRVRVFWPDGTEGLHHRFALQLER